MNAVVTDNRNDWVELNHISHQSDQGGGCSSNTRELHQYHGGGGGEGLRDELVVNDDNSNKAHVVTIGESSLLKLI